MKKLITIGMIAVFAFSSLMAFEVDWSGTARVRGGIIKNAVFVDNAFGGKNISQFTKDASTTSWKSQRIRATITGEADNGVKFVIRSKWSNGDMSTASDNVIFDRAYIAIPDAFLGADLNAGLIPVYAHGGMVVDDNFPGYSISKSMGDMSFGAGVFTLDETNNSAASSQTDINADDDVHGFMLSFAKNNVGPGNFGIDVMGKTNYAPDNTYKPGNIYWVSPWYVLDGGKAGIDNFSVDINPIFMTASFDKNTAAKKKDGSIFALSLKPNFTLSSGANIGGTITYIQGVKADKQGEDVTWSNIKSFYMNGLEFFGAGNPSDGMPGAMGLGNTWSSGLGAEAYGLQLIAITVDQPVAKDLTAHAALGYANTDQKVGDKTDLGTEFDLGVSWKVKENVSWNITGVYVAPGKALVGNGDDDALTALNSYLEYSF